MDTIWSFGLWVKQRRRSLDITQEHLASIVGCSVALISKIEGDARRPSREIAALLAQHLGLPPPEHQRFIQVARGMLSPSHLPAPATHSVAGERLDLPALAAAPIPSRASLPTWLTPLIGRTSELATVIALLQRPYARLVTLTGPPGTGKTRMAIEVAARSVDIYPDGVWFVDLASVSDPALVAPAIAHALRLQDIGARSASEQLTATLRPMECLLVLDNFEQVTDAALLVAELLSAAPRVRVLATSRVPLHVRGEHVHTVPPLALPARLERASGEELSAIDLSRVSQAEAAALFIERAESVDERFALTSANAAAVAELCWRLDGLPLAIELAAAQVRLLQPEALLRRIETDQGLEALSSGWRDLPARQQTLQATIDWSYRLLLPEEQTLLARLGVFAGSFDLAAVEAICAPPGGKGQPHVSEMADLLAALEEQNLVSLTSSTVDEVPRFTLLEVVRAFARERLRARDEEQPLRAHYAAYYLALAETAEPALRSADQLSWLERLDAEYTNLRIVLEWGLAAPDATHAMRACGVRMAAALWYYWFLRGRHAEAYRWLESPGSHDPAVPAGARARALLGASFIFDTVTWRSSVRPGYAEGIALAREASDPWLVLLGMVVSLELSDHAEAIAQAPECDDPWLAALALVYNAPLDVCSAALVDRLQAGLALARRAGDRYLIVESLCWQCLVALVQCQPERAQALSAEALHIARTSGCRYAAVMALYQTEIHAAYNETVQQAVSYCLERLANERAIGNLIGVSSSRISLCEYHRYLGDIEEVERLLDQADGAAEIEYDPSIGQRSHATLYWAERIELHLLRGDIAGAERLFQTYQAIPAPQIWQAQLWDVGGTLALAHGDSALAAERYTIALNAARQIPQIISLGPELPWQGELLLTAELSLVALLAGDLAQARLHLDSYLPFVASGMELGLRMRLHTISAQILLALGAAEDAGDHVMSGLRLVCRSGARALAPIALERAAELAIAQRRYTDAARSWGAAERLRAQIGTPIWPVDERRQAALIAACRAALGDTAFIAAEADGRERSWEAAIEGAITCAP